MTDYHPVTKEELDMIKNDCAYPEKPYCEGCVYCDEDEDITRASGFGCQFKGANVLMEEVLSRPDPTEHGIYTFMDCQLRDGLSNVCLVRHDCKTGKRLRSWLVDCFKLCNNKSCPRGYAR